MACFLQASDAYLQTNNQYLSLTDQMNLGVRVVELDTHFFDVSFVVTYASKDNPTPCPCALHTTCLHSLHAGDAMVNRVQRCLSTPKLNTSSP